MPQRCAGQRCSAAAIMVKLVVFVVRGLCAVIRVCESLCVHSGEVQWRQARFHLAHELVRLPDPSPG